MTGRCSMPTARIPRGSTWSWSSRPTASTHFRRLVRPGLINVDAPGATSANLRSLGHTRCRRPIFPLDRRSTVEPTGAALPAAALPRPAHRGGRLMKITKIVAVGLPGATPEGGWSNELKPDDCVHTLVAVRPTKVWPVSAACSPTIGWSRPRSQCWSRCTAARSPSSRSGSPRSCTSTRSGRAGAARDPRHQRRSTSRCGTCSAQATGQPVGRLLGGRYRETRPALCLDDDATSRAAARRRWPLNAHGLPRIQAGLGTVRSQRAHAWTRRSCRPPARRSDRTSR